MELCAVVCTVTSAFVPAVGLYKYLIFCLPSELELYCFPSLSMHHKTVHHIFIPRLGPPVGMCNVSLDSVPIVLALCMIMRQG